MLRTCIKATLWTIIIVVTFSGPSVLSQTTLQTSQQGSVAGSAQSETFVLSASIGGFSSPAGIAGSQQFAISSGFVGTLLDTIQVNIPPVISHSAVTSGEANQNITVTADIIDDSGLASVTLNFRQGGGSSFTSVDMTAVSGNQFEGAIPGNSVGDRGVDYFIEATDLGGLSLQEGVFSVRINIADPGIIRGSSQPGGTAQTAYRLISIPIEANNQNANSVLGDNLGTAGVNNDWRLFELLANQAYDEFPIPSGMVPGKAFWLIVRQPGKRIDSGAGRTNLSDQEFPISLNAGWNFVGNPFNFPIPISSNVYMESGDLDMRFFNGTEFSTFSGSMQPFDGYAVFSEETDRLMIDPNMTPANSELRKLTDPIEAKAVWTIRITAEVQLARDTENFASVLPDAAASWDRHDRPEAPVIGEYVSVYFPHPEWGKVSSIYATDARPLPDDGETWEFEVRSNIRDHIKIGFPDLQEVPAEFDVWLLDEALNVSQDLRKSPSYTYRNHDDTAPKQLKLLVGRREFIGGSDAIAQSIPQDFELAQNFPNPFNPSTTIRYGIPTAGDVILKVYNLRGAEIATLVEESKEAGFHLAFWNGKTDAGQQVASGVYVYRLQAGGKSITKKLAFLK